MPTVLERLAALFSRDMRAVLRNPRAISMIENPSERVQMAAIRRDRSVICFIDKPAERYSLPQSREPRIISISLPHPVKSATYRHTQQACLYRFHFFPYGKGPDNGRGKKTGMHLPDKKPAEKYS